MKTQWILVLLLAVCLAFSLIFVGCDDDDDDDDDDNNDDGDDDDDNDDNNDDNDTGDDDDTDECIPSCAGKECGPDGCDGLCGQCPPDDECVDWVCT